ncbi:MAG: bifunctional riboflavin kinase/FAD synthetase [Chloroflexi bacterium]|nr:bifunctional riboflavin kinase/FAD synthetase [Chloroflexota bacterium]
MQQRNPTETGVVLTIGVFDGVHRGHQDLIRRAVEHAHIRGLPTVCVTFDPDPDLVLRPESHSLALATLNDRLRRLAALGVDHVEVIPFSRDVSLQTPEQFIASLTTRFPLRSLWVATSFALGHDRTGTVEALAAIGQAMGFDVVEVPPLKHDGRRISSTWIRELLAAGDVRLAAELLGRPYCLDGVVISGMRRGRSMGFPTANVIPPQGRTLPADGVYFVQATPLPPGTLHWERRPIDGNSSVEGDSGRSPVHEGSYFGVVNLGGRPTFGETERLLETHLLNFESDLYGAVLHVCFIRQLREVRRFPNVEELRLQIERDVAAAQELVIAERARSEQ